MKFEIGRYGIRITPENEQDVAYIEDTLGMKQQDGYIRLMRVNQMGTRDIAYLETGYQHELDEETKAAIFSNATWIQKATPE